MQSKFYERYTEKLGKLAVRVRWSDIAYIVADSKMVEMGVVGETIHEEKSVRAILEKAPEGMFIIPRRGAAVNGNHVRYLSHGILVVAVNGKLRRFPVSRRNVAGITRWARDAGKLGKRDGSSIVSEPEKAEEPAKSSTPTTKMKFKTWEGYKKQTGK